MILSADRSIDSKIRTSRRAASASRARAEPARFHSSRHGPTTRADLDLFCSGFTGTTPASGRNQGHERQLAHGRRPRVRDDPRVFERLRRILCRDFGRPITLRSDAICRDIPREFDPSARTYASVVSADRPCANGSRIWFPRRRRDLNGGGDDPTSASRLTWARDSLPQINLIPRRRRRPGDTASYPHLGHVS